MALTPDELLGAIREAADQWDVSVPGSREQQDAAVVVVAHFQSLDQLLSSGFPLPTRWAAAAEHARGIADVPLPGQDDGMYEGRHRA